MPADYCSSHYGHGKGYHTVWVWRILFSYPDFVLPGYLGLDIDFPSFLRTAAGVPDIFGEALREPIHLTSGGLSYYADYRHAGICNTQYILNDLHYMFTPRLIIDRSFIASVLISTDRRAAQILQAPHTHRPLFH